MTRSFLTVPSFDKLSGVVHAFTTRGNGLGARNNGIKAPDDWNAVADLFHIPHDRLVTVNQVHGDTIVVVDQTNYKKTSALEADALVTSTPGIAIGVETADCVPILLVDPVARVVAAVHAGWRSTVQKIVQKTVTRMQAVFKAEPSRMLAAIGSAIGPECYEVDEPVMGPIREAFPFWNEVAVSRGIGKWGLDLVTLNQLELTQIGLAEQNVHAIGLCTSCRRDLFYSFRAEGRTGRMLSAIMIKP